MIFNESDIPQKMEWTSEEKKLLELAKNKCVCSDCYTSKDSAYLSGWDCPKHGQVKRFMYEFGLKATDWRPVYLKAQGHTVSFCPHCNKPIDIHFSVGS